MEPAVSPHNRKIVTYLVIIALAAGIVLSLTIIQMARAQAEAQGWRQSNTDGFDNAQNILSELAVFGGKMYAGTWNGTGPAQVWRTGNGHTWIEITSAFPVSTTTIIDMKPFGSYLYVGTDGKGGGQVWRTDGLSWEVVASNGFTSTNNTEVTAFTVFSDTLFAAARNPVTGVEVWRSITGDSGSWDLTFTAGADAPGDYALTTMDVYSGSLYLGISRDNLGELWRTSNGADWTPVFTDGLGNPNNGMVSAMAEFNGAFYIGFRNTVDGGEVWRSENGVSWTNVFTKGLGNVDNGRTYGLIPYDDQLYVIFSNYNTGAEVWRTPDGNRWQKVVSGGWGDSKNIHADYLDKGAVVFKDNLYLSTGNSDTGTEVWQLLHQVFMPLLLK